MKFLANPTYSTFAIICKYLLFFCVNNHVYNANTSDSIKSSTFILFDYWANIALASLKTLSSSLGEIRPASNLIFGGNFSLYKNLMVPAPTVFRHRQPAGCHRYLCNKLSTIHSKPKTFNCLKKYSIVIILIWAY